MRQRLRRSGAVGVLQPENDRDPRAAMLREEMKRDGPAPSKPQVPYRDRLPLPRSLHGELQVFSLAVSGVGHDDVQSIILLHAKTPKGGDHKLQQRGWGRRCNLRLLVIGQCYVPGMRRCL